MLRRLRRQPIFSLTVIATFALGIGAATAIFSVAYGVAFRPLPYRDPDRLVRLYEGSTRTNEPQLHVAEATFQAWREGVPSLESLALFTPSRVRYTPGDAPQPFSLMSVSPRFFDVLGVAPLHGRTFKGEADYGRGKDDEIVLSYEAWRRLFNADPAILGKPFVLSGAGDDDVYVIVGIMARGFAFDAPVDAWRAFALQLPVTRAMRTFRDDRVIARLRADRPIEQLRAELDTVSARLAAEFPASNAGWIATATPLRDAIIGRFARASWLLLAAVGAVLLVACANVAGLMTARSMARARETSVRLALGSGWWRLTRLWLGETCVLAAIGATAGVLVAWWFVRLLRAAAPPGLPRIEDIAVDMPALAVAVLATTIAAVVCAIVPLLTTGDRGLTNTLSAGSTRAGDTPARRRISAALVAVQCSAALALVVLSVVFARSFLKLTSVDLGWQPQHVLSLHVAPRWPQEIRRPWFLYTEWAQRLVARLEATPGIENAAITTGVPFSADNFSVEIARGGDPVRDETKWPSVLHSVTPSYFETMRLTLRRGRWLTEIDRFDEATLIKRITDAPGVAVISETLARTLWPGEDPIGGHFRMSLDRQPYEVVGVVADLHFTAIGAEPTLHAFVSWLQMPTGNPRLLVRASGDAAAIAPLVRDAVIAEHPPTGIDRVLPVETLVNRATAPARVTTQLLTALGVLALSLAAVGVYGGLAMLVQARAREIAVRIALGASPAQTLWRTMAYGLTPVVIGGAAGVLVALAAVDSVRSLLFGVDRIDIASLTAGGALVLAGTALACLAPALRAARTDAVNVLRAD